MDKIVQMIKDVIFENGYLDVGAVWSCIRELDYEKRCTTLINHDVIFEHGGYVKDAYIRGSRKDEKVPITRDRLFVNGKLFFVDVLEDRGYSSVYIYTVHKPHESIIEYLMIK